MITIVINKSVPQGLFGEVIRWRDLLEALLPAKRLLEHGKYNVT